MIKDNLPVAVIGAGPIGLAAAAHLSKRKIPFLVLEAGSQIAHNVRDWGHVSMFSPWEYNLDRASVKILSTYNWKKPLDRAIPTGAELVENYLLPLSETDEIKPHVRLNSKVIAISRRRINKIKNYSRERAPFVLRVETNYSLEIIHARAIIDASGTWHNPNPSGADGLPAIGEHALNDEIFYGIPDILGKARKKYKNKDVAVIGSGHSAINTLLELSDLKQRSKDVTTSWILTKAKVEDAYGGLDDDELPGRGKVGMRIKELVESKQIIVHTPFFVEEFGEVRGKIAIKGQYETAGVVLADEVIVATGLRPELTFLQELRISLDTSLECPTKLAPLIDPNIHSCGSVDPHGEVELRHPEKDFYIVGMKSYGRAPTFLLATGYEQVRSVVAGIAGDWDEARNVNLSLPESGVCGVPKAIDPNSYENEHIETIEADHSCC